MVTTEAIPYTSQTPAICTAPISDTSALTEHVRKLLHDDYLRNELRVQSIAVARQYDMKISCQRFEQTLASMINNRQN